MFELSDPSSVYQRSYLGAVDEFLAAGEERSAGLLSWPADDSFPGCEFTRDDLADQSGFARYADFLRRQRLEETPRPVEYVPSTMLWITDGETYLGSISLRHRLTDDLLTWGGHIGYRVRPSARRQGYATRALAAVLPIAASRGIDPALVTCDADNVASRRVIEHNGGVFEDIREKKLRFWVPTGRGPGPAT